LKSVPTLEATGMSAACSTVARLVAITWPLVATRLQRKLPVEGLVSTDLAAVSVRPGRRSEVSARVIVQAPSHLGLRAAGVEGLPEALLAAGLAERVGARRGTRLAPPAFHPSIDAGTGLLNPHGLGDHASRLADAVGVVLDEGAFPIVLGGDCTILLGITLALRRRGRFGLLFLDGHADFYQPEAEPTGEAASMELALVTGRGPELVTDLEGRRPLLGDEDVVVVGFRDADHAAAEGSRPLAPSIHAINLPSVRERGAGRAAGDALAHLSGPVARPGSGSTSMSTSSTTPSCLRSTTTSPTG
jgi:arginase family enzyme